MIALFWSWCLNVPSWLLCFGVVSSDMLQCHLFISFSFWFCFVYPLHICYACTVPSNLLWVSEFVILCTFLCNWFCVARFVFLCTIPCYLFSISRFWFLCAVPFSILQSTSTLQGHLSSPPVCSGVRIAQSLVIFLCSV